MTADASLTPREASTRRPASTRVDLRAALLRLDPDDRALLAMRYVAGFDSTELATATGIRRRRPSASDSSAWSTDSVRT